jgi:glycosyltransferase involved in cell wall biosynthesis
MPATYNRILISMSYTATESLKNGPDTAKNDLVAILMGVYQGARHLDAQLDSFAAQSHQNWVLVASDDSPDDLSGKRFLDWAAAHPHHDLSLVKGPQQGFVRNFLTLLATAPKTADFVALSDQDDVWFPDKLARATTRLSQVTPDRPALYCAATIICDENLNPVRRSAVFRKKPSFRNAMAQSVGGGNTMVLNRAALDLVQSCLPCPTDPVAHDWWLYQVISGHGGIVLRDDTPVLLYRQHADNLIGANMSFKARITRIRAVLGGRFSDWNTRNLAALQSAIPVLESGARQTLSDFSEAREGSVVRRIIALYRSGVVRQSALGTAALYIACLMGRL